MATYAIRHLQEHSEQPEVQMQELFTALTEYRDFSDFGENDWNLFFEHFSRKFDLVSEKLNKAETDRDVFMQELGISEAKYQDNADE